MKHDWKRGDGEIGEGFRGHPFSLKIGRWECRNCGHVVTTTNFNKHATSVILGNLDEEGCPFQKVKEIMES